MNTYNFIVYQNESGLVQQVTNTTVPNLPKIPKEDGVTAIHVGFYNDVTDTYYDPETGKFYEDAEKTLEISEPANYTKPVPEPVVEATASAE